MNFFASKKREIATNKFKAPKKKNAGKLFIYGRHSAEGSRQRNFDFLIFAEIADQIGYQRKASFDF